MRLIALGIIAAMASAGAATAAEPEVIAAPAEQAAPPTGIWTGGYVAISAGYGWLKDKDDRFVPTLRTKGSDPVYGISAGYLKSWGVFVAGVEGGYHYQRITFDNLPIGFPVIRTEEAWSLRGRIGAAYDRVLVTANAGAIYANTNIGMEDWGIIAGASIDYLLTDNIFAGLAYDHQFYRNFDGVPLDADIDTVQLRIGYKF